MWKQLTLEQRLIAVNVTILAVVGVFAYLLMTKTYEVPAPPPMELIEERLNDIPHEAGADGAAERKFARFGETDIFPALVPLPTPSPTPEPTPVPDPSLDEAIKQWKIKGITSGIVFIEDPRTREDFFMDIDDATNRTKTIRFRNEDMVVKLDSLDEINLSATFSYTGRQGKQTVTRSMFEE